MSKVRLQLAYTPENNVENVGDELGPMSLRMQSELERFKAFVESCGQEIGAPIDSLPYRAFL